MTDTTISLTKKQWKLMILKMLEQDEVIMNLKENKIKLVKVDGPGN